MAHWKQIKKVGRRCVSNKGKWLKPAACGGKSKKGKGRKAAKSTRKCRGSYHVKAYHVKAQNRKCPKRRR